MPGQRAIAAGDPSGVGGRLAPYRAVLACRVRSQRSYRANFALDLFSSLLVGFVELAEVWILFHNVHILGGFTCTQILLVFGIASILVGVLLNDIHWNIAHIGLLTVAIVCATATFAGMYIWAAGLQFFLISGAEMTNAFVYGGRYSATQPAAVWTRPLKVVFGFVFPMAFTAYLPALELLGLPGPQWLPAWLAWCTPLAATWTWAMALCTWRCGVRHYQGGGG